MIDGSIEVGIITLQATAHILTSSIVYKVTLTSIDMIKF